MMIARTSIPTIISNLLDFFYEFVSLIKMKKAVILFLIVVLFPLVSLAQPIEVSREIEIQEQTIKIEEEIDRLEGKLRFAKASARINTLKDLINGHRARLKKLNDELAELAKPKVEVVVEEVPEKDAEKEKEPWIKFQFGGMGGVLAGTTGIFADMRFPLSYVYGPATTSLRLAGGYAQSEDSGRRYVPLLIDGVLNFPPGHFTGVENYIGAGLNYVLITTGRTPGTIGGEVFYGVDGDGFGGKIFAELGYGILRTGFSPSHRGLSVLVGYRSNWSL
jgi:hypothetical protein